MCYHTRIFKIFNYSPVIHYLFMKKANQLDRQSEDNLKNPFIIGIVIAIVLLGINMRSPIIGFGAVAHLVQADLALSTKMIGLIGTIPMFAFALSSFIAPKIAKKLGLENTIIVACMMLAIGIFGRVWQADIGFILFGTILLSLAISFGNVLVPAVIKKFTPQHIGLVMGLYSLTLSVMAGVSTGIAMKLVKFGGWQFALGIWGWVSVFALVAWLILKHWLIKNPLDYLNNATKNSITTTEKTSVWKMPLAWWISGFMGIQSLLYYTLASFLPSLLIDKGLTEQQAGTMGMYFQFMAFPSIMLLSRWVSVGWNLRTLAMIASLSNLLGVIGFGFLSLQWVWLWAILTGFGCGVIFTLCLMLFTIKSRDSVQAGELSGMAQTVGYTIAILGPLLTGWFKDISQGWTIPMLFLTILMSIKCICAWFATQDKPLE